MAKKVTPKVELKEEVAEDEELSWEPDDDWETAPKEVD